MIKKHVKILTFSGSTRRDSFNKRLTRLAVDVAQQSGFSASFLDLSDYPLPLYDGDFESNSDYPENATIIKNIMKEHAGFLIASPEYNSSISAVLKNTIDWVSRSDSGGTDLSAFTGKIAALVSAAPGQLGGLRGLVHLRSILSNIGTIVIPNQLAIPKCSTVFDDQGKLLDQTQMTSFEDVVMTLLDSCQRFTIDLHHYNETLFNELDFKD